MTVSNTVKIGAELIDITRPGDVAAALRKMQLKLATGGIRETVRIDGEEITFQRADDRRLEMLIKKYDAESARQGGGRRQRFAKRFRFS